MDFLKKTTTPRYKQEYFGNGKNAIYGIIDSIEEIRNGHKVHADKVVIRYSYRWHKAVWRYSIDGVPCTRWDVKRILK